MYYFAYGANLDTNYLAKYICSEDIHIVGSAYIDNYIFRYCNINTSNLRSGVANIEPRKGSKTYGVIYEFDNSDILSNIDIREGYISDNNSSNIYDKITLECTLLDTDKKVHCCAYVMNDLVKLGERKPRLKYLSYLKNGNTLHNLPREHLHRIHYLEK